MIGQQRMQKLAKLEKGPTPGAPERKVPKGLKHHRFHEEYEKMRWIVRQMGVNGMLSLILGVWLNELKWHTYDTIPARTPDEGPVYTPSYFSTTVEVFKFVVSANVLLVLFNLTRYYSLLLKIGKASGTLLPQDTLYSAGLLGGYVTEFVVS